MERLLHLGSLDPERNTMCSRSKPEESKVADATTGESGMSYPLQRHREPRGELSEKQPPARASYHERLGRAAGKPDHDACSFPSLRSPETSSSPQSSGVAPLGELVVWFGKSTLMPLSLNKDLPP